jgi:alpha-beta hydrolase superfamily lysophospholipase
MHVAESLVKEGFEVNMIDLRGFGFSGGPRASSTIHELHMDIETLIQ